MRLLVTGAFVRAAQSARIATSHQLAISSTARVISTRQSRWQSTQAASIPPSNDTFAPPSAPLDIRAAATEPLPQPQARGPDVEAFEEKLRGGPPSTIIQDGNLSGVTISGKPYTFDKTSNLSPSILNLVGRELYNIPNHPLCITRKLIQDVFKSNYFIHHHTSSPVVTTKLNFDALGFPEDHPGRSRTDTYYVDSDHVLRTHTSAHQAAAFEHMAQTRSHGYTICADVYRRDSIDRSHFPVFHQMEGARCWNLHPSKHWSKRWEDHKTVIKTLKDDMEVLPKHTVVKRVENARSHPQTNPIQTCHDEQVVRLTAAHLKKSLEVLVERVFTAAREAGVGGEAVKDQPLQIRWVEAYFPFTSPSFELEVLWDGEWLELLGCGIVQQAILKNAGLSNHIGWAWGLGVERLAMILFGIPDIRLFWSTDERFLSQFQEDKVTKFVPFSKFPSCYKDVAFWIPSSPSAASPLEARSDSSGIAAAAGGDATKASPTETQPAAFHENDVMEIVRDIGGTLVEDVKLVDEFVHPSTGRKSLCYRINYRSLERTLTNDEVNDLHSKVTVKLKDDLQVELR